MNLYLGSLVNCIRHAARGEAFPNQLIETELVTA